MSTSAPPAPPVNSSERKKITTRTFKAKKQRDEVITMLTAYDYHTAQVIDHAGIDSILVGDSLGMVMLGFETTLPVTMDMMLHHCKAVARGAQFALLIGDMPFMSYQVSVEEALHNAGQFLQHAGMDAVKLEGGRERARTIRALVAAGIPVMGHLGLTPQSVHQLGGFRTQGRSAQAAERLVEDALLLQDSGCFSVVLESVPHRLANLISEQLEIPTIGIGAGVGCDGQVLVTHDLLGLFDQFKPSFVKAYANLHQDMLSAFQNYQREVDLRQFPDEEHSFSMSDQAWDALQERLAK